MYLPPLVRKCRCDKEADSRQSLVSAFQIFWGLGVNAGFFFFFGFSSILV